MHATWKGPGSGKGSRKKDAQEKRRKAEEQSRKRREERQKRKGETASSREGGAITEATTALERYDDRRAAFRVRRGALGALEHAAWWWVHNCVAHPLLGALPGPLTVRFHDWTSARLNLRSTPTPSPPPVIADRAGWLWHNCVAHPLIGLCPTRALFELHDESAEQMGVEGWV